MQMFLRLEEEGKLGRGRYSVPKYCTCQQATLSYLSVINGTRKETVQLSQVCIATGLYQYSLKVLPSPLSPVSEGRKQPSMLQNPAPTRSPAMAQPGFRRELDPDQQDQQGQQDHQHMDQNQQDHRGQQDHQHMDFFGKLGYSPGEVKAALQRLGLSTDVNSVLGELVGSTAPHHQLPSHPIADSDRRSTGRKDLGLRLSRAPGAHGLAVLSAPPPQPPAPPLAPAAQTRNGRDTEDELKAVVIDGSNVAMSHGNKEVFSCQGILLAVNYFLVRGHTTVTVFVPSWRKEQPRPDAPITEQHILTELEKRKLLVFTPSRRVGGKRVVCYDDRFIVKLAHESDGVIVSNDTYRDLQAERPEWRKCIEERLLMYSFVNDKFMPPDDPLGRYGPNLDDFLRKKPLASEQNRPLCPYDKKCTYGIKCKFYHPERAQQSYSSLADELRERARTSAGKLESTGAVSPRGPHRDPSLTPDLRFLDCDMEHRSSPEQRHSACPAPRVTENALVCRDDSCRTAQNHAVGSPARVRAQKGWPSPARCAQSSLSQDRLDSGLGSYESPFSDSQLLWSRPQQPPPHLSEPDGARPVCGCCPPVAPPPGAPRHCSSTSLGSCSRAQYDTFSPYTVYTPSMHHFYSLPGLLQHGGQQHGRQPNFWSDPFNAPPKAMSPPPGGPGCSYRDPGSPLWAPPGQCPVTVHPERLELRKKLQAIFNPCQVDAVMEMFPNLTDAQTLAAEILKLRAQRGF